MSSTIRTSITHLTVNDFKWQNMERQELFISHFFFAVEEFGFVMFVFWSEELGFGAGEGNLASVCKKASVVLCTSGRWFGEEVLTFSGEWLIILSSDWCFWKGMLKSVFLQKVRTCYLSLLLHDRGIRLWYSRRLASFCVLPGGGTGVRWRACCFIVF